MDKSLLHYVYIYVIQEMTLLVAKLTICQWYMSDRVRNIGGMTLTGKIEVHLALFYGVLAFLEQEVIDRRKSANRKREVANYELL